MRRAGYVRSLSLKDMTVKIVMGGGATNVASSAPLSFRLISATGMALHNNGDVYVADCEMRCARAVDAPCTPCVLSQGQSATAFAALVMEGLRCQVLLRSYSDAPVHSAAGTCMVAKLSGDRSTASVVVGNAFTCPAAGVDGDALTTSLAPMSGWTHRLAINSGTGDMTSLYIGSKGEEGGTKVAVSDAAHPSPAVGARPPPYSECKRGRQQMPALEVELPPPVPA